MLKRGNMWASIFNTTSYLYIYDHNVNISYCVQVIRGKSKIFMWRYKWQRTIKMFAAFHQQAIHKFNLPRSKHNRTNNQRLQSKIYLRQSGKMWYKNDKKRIRPTQCILCLTQAVHKLRFLACIRNFNFNAFVQPTVPWVAANGLRARRSANWIPTTVRPDGICL